MYWEQMVYTPNQKILLKSEDPTSSWSKTPPNFTDSEEKMGSVAKKSAERLAPPADFYAFTEYPLITIIATEALYRIFPKILGKNKRQ